MDTLIRLAALLLIGYLGLCTVLYLLQDRLIFLPRDLQSTPRGDHVQAASIEHGEVTLRGWIVNPGTAGPLVIYFGGNAEELSTLVEPFSRLRATTVLINYRGYGESDGTPSADALIADARHVVRVMSQRLGSDRRLILFGRSLGSGIAVQAAAARPADALILLSPYRSLGHLARRQLPFVPVDRLLRHRIDARAAIEALPDEILVLHAERDYVIRPEESAAFAALLDPPPRIVTFDGGHNIDLIDPALWRPVREFIER